MQEMLEDWFNKLTFAIATWKGDAQRYWLDQALETARARHDQWLQSPPDQRASLEPAYILGDQRLIPEAAKAVESVLRTELLEVIPKTMADSCMRLALRGGGHRLSTLIFLEFSPKRFWGLAIARKHKFWTLFGL